MLTNCPEHDETEAEASCPACRAAMTPFVLALADKKAEYDKLEDERAIVVYAQAAIKASEILKNLGLPRLDWTPVKDGRAYLPQVDLGDVRIRYNVLGFQVSGYCPKCHAYTWSRATTEPVQLARYLFGGFDADYSHTCPSRSNTLLDALTEFIQDVTDC